MLQGDILRVIDSNILIRYLVGDTPLKMKKIKEMLGSPMRKFILTDVTVAEIVWVLSSYYKFKKREIVEKILSLFDLSSIEANTSLLTSALVNYSENSVDYVDAYLAAYCLDKDLVGVVSFDRDLDKISGIKRFEP